MTDPRAHDDNSWDELARELGLSEPTTDAVRSAAAEEFPVAEELGDFEEAGLIEAEPGSADLAEGDEEGEAGDPEAADTGEDGQPGTGRKRRRRRRRRRGKGGASEPAAEEAEAASEEDTEVPATATEQAHTTHLQEDDDDEEEVTEVRGAILAAEEDTGSEVLRELINTWNVPSWDDIVTGLYRPDR